VAKRGNAAETGGPMYRAAHYFCRMSAFKIRPVIDMIRGLDASEAREALKYSKRRGALFVDRVLLSAMSNAEQAGADVEDLVVARVVADEGPTLKRWRAGPHGRVRPILKRRAHIEIELRPRAAG
jgi:large subunit ribosomal protein L22